MLISVVIPTRDRPEAVLNAAKSVFESEYDGEFEVFVIDQSSDDATRVLLAAEFGLLASFHYVVNSKSGVGAASSRNIGIAASSGDILSVIDDDVTVSRDWMAKIAVEFAADPGLEFICGKLTAPPYDPSEGFTPSFDADSSLSRYEMPIAAAGANFSMRRTLLDRIGGYDEFCGPGSKLGASDDGDLTWRIVRSGAKWKACAHIEVVHTFGFRKCDEGASLLKRYQMGLGGNFGRFTRRGDLFAAVFFLTWQARDLGRAFAQFVSGRRVTGLGWIAARMIGFARGVALTSREGFITGDKLRGLRIELQDAPMEDDRSLSSAIL
jgi:glycosyltransferase involved in cell wall biosynthesis